MKKFSFLIIIVTILVSVFVAYSPSSIVRADEVEELQKQINELEKNVKFLQDANKTNEQQLKGLKTQLENIKLNIQGLSNKIVQKEKELAAREEKISNQQELLNQRIRNYYIRSYLTNPLLVIFSSSNASDLFRELSYRIKTADEDQKVITGLTNEVVDLNNQKKKLEKDKSSLTGLQASIDKQASFLEGEVKKAKDYESTLKSQIAELSAKQQSILAARSGSFTASIGDSELADDVNASIRGFRDSAPSGYFAVFSFGAHTHRKGMSQYGARGRAQSGQDYKAILRAYYGKEPTSKDTGGDISVSGFGSMSFEEKYLYGIAEMPSSWHPEALKAQAVAARTSFQHSGIRSLEFT